MNKYIILTSRVSSFIIFISSSYILYEDVYLNKSSLLNLILSVGFFLLFNIPYLYLAWFTKLTKKEIKGKKNE